MKKYRIALAGTFDVENYGDLMFPVVFEKAMKKKGLNFDLVLFSPLESAPEALDKSKTVYSFRDFERMNNESPFDALVIGGGALIHFKDFMVRTPGKEKKENYHNIHSWLSLMYLASSNNIKILFNVPQVPFETPIELKALMKAAFDQVDYFAVRDEFSKKYIDEIYNNKSRVKVYPDTVTIIDEIFDKKELVNDARKLLGFDEEYMVFHFQFTDGIQKEVYPELDKVVGDAEERGVKVVLLPIGYTHGDKETMAAYKEYCKDRCVGFDRKLNINEMTAILAGAKYYVGMSFHGSLVTLAFGGRAFTINPSLKNQELFKKYGIRNCLAASYDDLLKEIDLILPQKNTSTLKHKKMKEEVNEHFNNMYYCITKGILKRKTPEIFLDELCLTLPRLESLTEKIGGLEKSLQNADFEIKKQKDIIKEKDEKIKKINTDLNAIRESLAFKVGKKITFVPHIIKNKFKK